MVNQTPYPVTLFVAESGYLKKITPQSLRMPGEQKLKEGDRLFFSVETSNRVEVLVFTYKCQVYKSQLSDFDDFKASAMGDYLPPKLGFNDGERFLTICLPEDYSGFLLLAFANGKVAKVAMAGYSTKQNRKKLQNAYSGKAPLVSILALNGDTDIVLTSSDTRTLVVNTALLVVKATRSTQGVSVQSLKRKATLQTM